MTFEDKFLELIQPFLELVEPNDDASADSFDEYFLIEERIAQIKTGLENLAKGDPAALTEIVTFFTDEKIGNFIAQPNVASFPKLLALASNITSDTWSKEIDPDAPYEVIFLQGDDQIEQPYAASGVLLAHYFYNGADPKNSVALIDFRRDPDVQSLRDPEFWPSQGRDLIEAWTIVLLLQNMGDINGCVALISAEENPEKAVSYLKYHLVMDGNKLTLPVPLPVANHISDVQERLIVATDYTQFNEPFGMLGGVNSCDNILDAFLSTYHVLENYMIRSEVSAVLSNTTGRNFQRVRDFKRLGQQTDASEITHLTKLFRQCWDTMIGAKVLSASLADFFDETKADQRWNVDEFDEFLVQLGILNGNGNQVSFENGFQDIASIQNNFVKLVYAVRCSIVHNKATEFHLSNEELKRKDIRVLVIVKLCLPVMKRLAFGLPSSLPVSNPIHYSKRELMFY